MYRSRRQADQSPEGRGRCQPARPSSYLALTCLVSLAPSLLCDARSCARIKDNPVHADATELVREATLALVAALCSQQRLTIYDARTSRWRMAGRSYRFRRRRSRSGRRTRARSNPRVAWPRIPACCAQIEFGRRSDDRLAARPQPGGFFVLPPLVIFDPVMRLRRSLVTPQCSPERPAIGLRRGCER
jgi:hypothetical protein